MFSLNDSVVVTDRSSQFFNRTGTVTGILINNFYNVGFSSGGAGTFKASSLRNLDADGFNNSGQNGLLAQFQSSSNAILNEISALLTAGGTVVVTNYDELRETEGDLDHIVVANEDVGGVFYRDDTAGDDNNCLVIERTDGGKYVRLWDRQNFNVEWIPVGTVFDHQGISRTVSAEYPGDKIAAALEITDPHTTIHLKQNETYEVSLRCYQSGHTIAGHRATVKRGDQISSTCAVQAEIGATSITVADASGFRVGDRIYAVITSGVVGGHAMIATSGTPGFAITSIVGNTLHFNSQPLIKQVVVGKKIVVLNSIFWPASGETNRARFYDLIIDGNNTEHADVLDWAAGFSMNQYELECDNVWFYNSPNESIATIGSGAILNCKWFDCWGSCVHLSNSVGNIKKGVLIQNCYGQNVATKDSGHSEGCITFSAHSMHARVEDCVFDNSAGTRGTGVFGLGSSITGDQDDHFFVSNVKANNYLTIINMTASASSIPMERVTIVGSLFDTCGSMNFGSSGLTPAKDVHFKHVQIKDNRFVNCWFNFRNIRNLEFDNVCTWDFGYTGFCCGSRATVAAVTTRIGGTPLADGDFFHLYQADGGNPQGNYVRTAGAWVHDPVGTSKLPTDGTYACMLVEQCGRVRISGTFQGPPIVSKATLVNGIYLSLVGQKLVTEAGTSAVGYMTEVNLEDLTLIDHTYNVVCDVATGPWAATPATDVSHWRYNNVKVFPRRESTVFGPTVFGLDVLAGCIASNCTVMLPDTATGASTTAINLKGPVTNSSTLGGMAFGCVVPFCPGSSVSIRFGHTAANQRNNNCVAVGNFINKAATQNGSGVNIDSNTVLSSALLTAMTAQAVVPYRPVGYNQSAY